MRILLTALVMIAASPPAMAQIVPHHAIYDVQLVKRSAGDHLINLSGTFEFTMDETCDHWSTHHHADMTYYYGNGESLESKNEYSSIEYLNSHRFHYAAEQRANGRIRGVQRGRASYDANTNTLIITENQGRNGVENSTVSGDFSFPVHHTMELLARAQSGQKFYATQIFDGAEENTAYRFVSAVIGKQNSADTNKSVWPISMAFYAPDSNTAMPEYEMHFDLQSNGVVEQMDITYPTFTVRQTLNDLKLLEKPRCD